MKLGKVIHLGIVVENVEQSAGIYESCLGVGPWEIQNAGEFFDRMDVSGGRGLKIKTAMFHGDGYEIELIEPTGEGIYADWLEKHGPGLHHLKFDSDDTFETVVKEAEEISGRPPYLDVKWPDGRPLVAYADLQKECGLLIEISPGEE